MTQGSIALALMGALLLSNMLATPSFADPERVLSSREADQLAKKLKTILSKQTNLICSKEESVTDMQKNGGKTKTEKKAITPIQAEADVKIGFFNNQGRLSVSRDKARDEMVVRGYWQHKGYQGQSPGFKYVDWDEYTDTLVFNYSGSVLKELSSVSDDGVSNRITSLAELKRTIGPWNDYPNVDVKTYETETRTLKTTKCVTAVSP